jgi:hypothetical protein
VYNKDIEKDAEIRSSIILKLQDVFQTEGYKNIIQ